MTCKVLEHRPILYKIAQNSQHGYCQPMSGINFELPTDTTKRLTLKFESIFSANFS